MLRFQTKDRFGKTECRELCMDCWGFLGGIDRGRISKRNVPNGYPGAGEAPGVNVYHRIEGYDYPCFKDSAVEDRSARGHKCAPPDRCAGNMCMWSHQHVMPKHTRMLSRTSDHRVFHNDAVLANPHGRSLRAYDSTG